MIEELINTDLKNAMLSKDSVKTETLRGIKSAFMVAKTEKNATEFDDSVALKVLQKLSKQRNESASIYKENNRMDLYTKEILEAEIIQAYLPKQLSETDINNVIETKFNELGLEKNQKAMGLLMKEVNKELVGQADGKLVSSLVKAFLGL